jgi:hypothetical protein
MRAHGVKRSPPGPQADVPKEVADLEAIGNVDDPVLRGLLSAQGTRRHTELNKFVVPRINSRFKGKAKLYTPADHDALSEVLGGSGTLPWPKNAGPDLILVDPDKRRIAARDLTRRPNSQHQAEKAAQVAQLRARLGQDWTVDDDVRDFYHRGKGRLTTADVVTQLRDLLIDFGYEPESDE